jgi:molecular chaperone DnaJ
MSEGKNPSNCSELGSVFDSFFDTTWQPSQRRGADIYGNLSLSFEEAVGGCKKSINILRSEICAVCYGSGSEPGSSFVKCPECRGSGQVRHTQSKFFGRFAYTAVCPRCRGKGKLSTNPCHECHGRGRIHKRRKIEVSIPPGVDENFSINLQGEGDAGVQGGLPGNLSISITISDHRFFKRDGSNIIYDIYLSFVQATLGDKVEIPTMGGNTILEIPPGTQTGEIFYLKGKGVPHFRGQGRGDQLVRVFVVTPTTLSESQKKLLRELSKTLDKLDKIAVKDVACYQAQKMPLPRVVGGK